MYLFLSSYIILKEKGKFLNVLNNHSCYFSGILTNNLMIYQRLKALLFPERKKNILSPPSMNKKKSLPLFNGISGPDDQLQRQWLNFTSPAASTASKFHSFLHTNLNVLLVNHRSILRRLSTLQQFTHLFFSSLFTHIRKNELAAPPSKSHSCHGRRNRIRPIPTHESRSSG